MGKPLTIQPQDDAKLEELKIKIGAKSKVDVLRSALILLDSHTARLERIERWRNAARIVGRNDNETFAAFQKNKERFKKLP